jgi:hypothetical protein
VAAPERHNLAVAIDVPTGAPKIQFAADTFAGCATLPPNAAVNEPPVEQLSTSNIHGPLTDPLHPSVGATVPAGVRHE